MTTDENDTCEDAAPDREIDLGERKTDPSGEPVGEATNPEVLPGDTEPPPPEPATDPAPPPSGYS